jgi:hypothetical protein
VPPVVWIGGCERANGAELAGVVDEQIYRTHRLLDGGDHVVYLLAVGDIARDGERLAVPVCDLSGNCGDLVFGARADGHGRACVAQGQGDRPAETPADSGDQRGLAVQTNRWPMLQ